MDRINEVVTVHPLREALLHEAHARPFESLSSPLRVSHLVVQTGTSKRQEEVAHMAALSQHFDRAEPSEEAAHFILEAPDFRLRWERHTEFSTYTIFANGAEEWPFSNPAIALLPVDWLGQLPGELLSAMHVTLLSGDVFDQSGTVLTDILQPESLAGSYAAGGAARVWTDFIADEQGYLRFLVANDGLTAQQAGRLVQRLLEVETYRFMALLGFPLARELGPDVTAMERELGALMDRLATVSELSEERDLLAALSQLSARVERLMAKTNFRFSATAAYGTLVRRRLNALREQRIEGLSTLDEFMERRLAPALDTCVHMGERLERVSRRLSRAANLLRTRVDVALEAQNRDLLDSMNRRARLQLRLQQTVEGLSVVVMSYYTVSLIGYALRGAGSAGWVVSPEVLTALSIPVVIAGIAIGVRVLRRRATRSDETG